MLDVVVRFAAAALADPTNGLAAVLPQAPGVPSDVALRVPRVVDETSTPWVARGAVPSVNDLKDGPLLLIIGGLSGADDDASTAMPWTRAPVLFCYVARGVESQQLLAAARYTENAIIRSILRAFPAPQLETQGVVIRRPVPQEFARGKQFEPWGDVTLVSQLAVHFATLDAWTFNLT